MATSPTDSWAFELDAARRDVRAAAASVEEALARAVALVPATAWASPAMHAFQERSEAWRAAVGGRLAALERADDAFEAWRSYVLVHAAALAPADPFAWFAAGRRGADAGWAG